VVPGANVAATTSGLLGEGVAAVHAVSPVAPGNGRAMFGDVVEEAQESAVNHSVVSLDLFFQASRALTELRS